jgi:hypothetical protein
MLRDSRWRFVGSTRMNVHGLPQTTSWLAYAPPTIRRIRKCNQDCADFHQTSMTDKMLGDIPLTVSSGQWASASHVPTARWTAPA